MAIRTFTCLLFLASASVAGAGEGPDLFEFPVWFQAQQEHRTMPVSIESRDLPQDAEGWAQLIDDTWGEGASTGEKLFFFDRFWRIIDEQFACFQDLDVDWQGVRDRYRPEVAAGVSKGRFAAIMSRLSLALMEAHTSAYDRVVQWRTGTVPGVPLLVVGGWGDVQRFGACLTPLPDRSMLVYKAPDDHPLALVPGDIVTGFDGRPWTELFPEMLDFGLPVTGFWASSPEGFEHSWLMAAGANWHLFDTIDIVRTTGEVVHVPTSVMEGWRHQLWCTEQLPVAGVEFPDYNHSQLFSWGLIEGTSIGYIYGWGWAWNAEEEFRAAVDALMHEHDTDGLIIDFRFNMGGNLFLSNEGLELLFDETVSTIDFATRCLPVVHDVLCPLGRAGDYLIQGDPETFYDRPIAVLVGPGAVSTGDQVALRLGFHPMVRFFGKSTNTAFNAAALAYDGDEWQATFAFADAYLLDSPGEYLTHDPLPVDYEVWLTGEDVAAGRDTVVEAAAEWIREFEFAPRQPSGRVAP